MGPERRRELLAVDVDLAQWLAVGADLDDIVRASGLPVATVRVVLLELDLAGRLIRDAAGRASLA